MDYDQDLKKAMGWNRINLELIGIWPNLTLSKEQLPNYRPLIICVWISLFLNLPQSVNLFMLDGDLALITDNLCLANIPAINAIIKMIITWYHREDLRLLVKSFYDDWYSPKTEEERATMMNRANITQSITIWCTLLCHSMNAAYISLRTFTIVTIDRSNEMQDRLLLFPAYFPYNVQPPLILLLTNMGQAFACCLGTCLYTSIDVFIAMLVLHVCGQFENLKRRLEGLMDEKNGTRSTDDIRKKLRSIVERHEHLNWVATMIDKCFSQLLLLQLVLCTIEICFQGFMFFNIMQNEAGIFNKQMVFFVPFVSVVIVHMYIYCYIGEMLLFHSTGMNISAYYSNWFNVSPADARCLIFIMCRSTRPAYLRAGKFGIFSLEMFSTILRTAVGYLSVLLTVTGNSD